MYRKLCELGFYLRFNIPKQFGGLGITDYRYNTVIVEETGMECVETAYEIVRSPFHGVKPCFFFHSAEYMDVGSFSISLGNDVVLSYFTKNCTPAQRAVWLPKISAEGKILAVAMSEPELGSDLGSLSCRAVLFAAALLSTFVLLAPLCLRCIHRKACVSVVLRAAIAMHARACQVKSADGTYFTLTGRKMWISAGSVCDYVVVSAVTDPKAKYRYVECT